ncbi:MAG: InlB B-repeat-containing protein, partial [Acidimicrobiales bacterium]
MTTLSTTFVNVGDLLVIWVQSKDTAGSIHVTGIAASGTGSIGTPSAAIAYNTVDHPNNTDEIWYASVTAAGSVTLTFSWSSSTTSVACEYAAQEFQPSAPATYSLDKATSLEVGTSSTTIQFPSLTPANSGEVYAGYNSNNTSGIYGSPTTAGYTVERGFISYDAIIYDPGVSSSVQSPYTTASANATVQSSIGALIVGTPVTDTYSYDTAGGSTAPAGGSGANGSTITLASAPTRSGYTFGGWSDGTSTYAAGASYTLSSNGAAIVFTAQWT